ncbi:MAG: helix-turn-helix transcriptional regulator [Nitrospirota bacterium]|jgi:transcriptional regulator with XRE-family HTH domain
MQTYNFPIIDDAEGHREEMIKTFGENIKNLRLRKKMTQEQVAEMSSINPKYLGEIERGEKCPTVVVVYKISKALNVSICEILSIDNCPHISADQIRKVERLFSGKDKKDIHKAIRILEVFFFE